MTKNANIRISHGHYVGLLIFCLAFFGLIFIESVVKSDAIVGIYMHGIPSESMMQTVSLIDLKEHGLQTIWNLHVQPPLFDIVRMVLVKVSGTNNPLQMQYFVDQGIYFLWAFIYGLSCALVFYWASRLTNVWYAIFIATLFALSPSALLYATLLETTFLSSFLILWLIYLLWKIKIKEQVSPYVLATSFLLLFFTRSIFQWQWIILLMVCLLIMGYPKLLLRKFLIISSIIVFSYLGKQYILFDIGTSSSLTGINLCQSIQACKQHVIPEDTLKKNQNLAEVLTRNQKITGAHNFNNLVDLELDKAYKRDYWEKIQHTNFMQLAAFFYHNALIYFEPSSNYASSNLFLVKLSPRWKNYYEKFLSKPILPSLLVLLSIIWLVRTKKAEIFRSLGIFLPVFAIIAISIAFESGENMRFKFFVEPLLFIFISSQMYWVGMQILKFLKK